jgi:hypothetical protein
MRDGRAFVIENLFGIFIGAPLGATMLDWYTRLLGIIPSQAWFTIAMLSISAIMIIARYFFERDTSVRELKEATGFFVGRWRVGIKHRSNRPYFIELHEGHRALRRSADRAEEAAGSWKYFNGEAVISWEDGWTDALRCTCQGEVIKIGVHRSKPHEPDYAEPAIKESRMPAPAGPP